MTSKQNERFKFIDLFAGIGGIRIAFDRQQYDCVMTSEIDKWARETYRAYFNDPDGHMFNEDITSIKPEDVPDHDVLTGGFPCQPFSLAGVAKKNSLGRAHGFDDPNKGNLFFYIQRILKEKKPRAFLLENVKNLRSHDKGRTWKVIQALLSEAGYVFADQTIDAARVVPQHRERIFIVGFNREHFDLPEYLDWSGFWAEVKQGLVIEKTRLRKRYSKSVDETIIEWPLVKYILEPHENVPEKYTLTPNLWRYLREYKAKHQALGNGFGYSVFTGEERYTRTISARYYKDGSEVLIDQGEKERPRRLTPYESAQLQGFPEDFLRMFNREDDGYFQPVSDTQAYKQFGNSVCVPVVTAIAKTMDRYLREPELLKQLPHAAPPEEQLQLDGIPSLMEQIGR